MGLLDLTELKQKFSLEDYPISIVGNGSIATITLANHNFKTGNYLNITGTTNYNGLKLVTRLSPTQLTFSTTFSTTENGIIKNHDSSLNKLIKQVEDFITQECDMQYGNETESSEILDLTGTGFLFPKRGKLDSSNITSILLSKEQNFTDSTKYITLSSSDFFVYEDRIELKFEKCSSYLNCQKSVKITYTTLSAPDGLKSIAESLFEFHFRNLNDKSINQKSKSQNGDQVVYRDEIPDFINKLYPYKRICLGDY